MAHTQYVWKKKSKSQGNKKYIKKGAYCSTGAVASLLCSFGTACFLAVMKRPEVTCPVRHLTISPNRASNAAAEKVTRLLFTSPRWHVVIPLTDIELRRARSDQALLDEEACSRYKQWFRKMSVFSLLVQQEIGNLILSGKNWMQKQQSDVLRIPRSASWQILWCTPHQESSMKSSMVRHTWNLLVFFINTLMPVETKRYFSFSDVRILLNDDGLLREGAAQ